MICSIEGAADQLDSQAKYSCCAQIYEGEHDEAAENTLLGTLQLSGIQLRSSGEPKLMINFELNEDGILEVTAQDITVPGRPGVPLPSSAV